MSTRETELTIRKILVALDASPHSLAALEAAVDLAASSRAELIGLFVEDITLLQLAQFPFARQISFYSTTIERVESQHVERQLRVRARQVQQLMAAAAGQAQVRWTFRVARGPVAAEILAAALQEADLISLGRVGWSLAGRRRLGSTAQAVLTRAPKMTLILHHGVRLRGPFVVLYDGSATAHRALSAGAQLARNKESDLVVLILANDADKAARLQAEVEAWVGEMQLQTRYRHLFQASAASIAHAIRTEQGGVLLLPGDSSTLDEKSLEALLSSIECPVLYVRGGEQRCEFSSGE